MARVPSPDSDGHRAALGQRVGEARYAAGLTQQDVAEALGLSRPGVAMIETGRQNVHTGTLLALAQILSVDPCWLLCGATAPQQRRAHGAGPGACTDRAAEVRAYRAAIAAALASEVVHGTNAD